MTSHDEGPRTSKPSSLPEEPDNRILKGYCGVKELSSPSPLHTGPKAYAEKEKHPRMNKEGPSCQETSLRTILSLANRNHKKKERHALKDSLPRHPKQKGLAQ